LHQQFKFFTFLELPLKEYLPRTERNFFVPYISYRCMTSGDAVSMVMKVGRGSNVVDGNFRCRSNAAGELSCRAFPQSHYRWKAQLQSHYN
jgi:hypothetical protein